MSDKSQTTDILTALRDPKHAGHLNAAAADEIERLRTRLSKIENASVDPGNTVAMTLKGWAAPRDGEPANG